MPENKLYQWKTKNDLVFDTKQSTDDWMVIEKAKDEIKQENPVEILEQGRGEVEENLPPKFSQMKELADKIRTNDYKFVDGHEQKWGKKKIKDNSTMSKVLSAIDYLNDLISSKRIDFGAMENLLDEDFNEVLDEWKHEIHRAFLHAISACQNYLDTHRKNPWTSEGKARRQMIEDFFDQLSEESVLFEGKCDALLNNAQPQFSYKSVSFMEVLENVRTEEYSENEKDVNIKKIGGQSSSLYEIKKEDTTIFFKPDEKFLPMNYNTAFDLKIKMYTSRKDTYKNINFDNCMNFIEDVKSWLNEKYPDPDEAYENFFTDIENNDLLSALRSNDCGNLINKYADLKREERKFLEDVMLDIQKVFNSAGLAKYNANIDPGADRGRHEVATTRMAELIGAEDLVVKSTLTTLTVNGEKIKGVSSTAAEGLTIAEASNAVKDTNEKYGTNFKLRYSPKAYQQLLSLQVLDILCGQVDRHNANYRVVIGRPDRTTNEVPILQVKGFDHDLSFGKYKYKDVQKIEMDNPSIRLRGIETDNEFHIPAMSEELADNILGWSPEMLTYKFIDILSQNELSYMIDRVTGVQRAIRRQRDREAKLKRKGKLFSSKFISPDDTEGWKQNMKAEAAKDKEKWLTENPDSREAKEFGLRLKDKREGTYLVKKVLWG